MNYIHFKVFFVCIILPHLVKTRLWVWNVAVENNIRINTCLPNNWSLWVQLSYNCNKLHAFVTYESWTLCWCYSVMLRTNLKMVELENSNWIESNRFEWTNRGFKISEPTSTGRQEQVMLLLLVVIYYLSSSQGAMWEPWFCCRSRLLDPRKEAATTVAWDLVSRLVNVLFFWWSGHWRCL